MTYREKEKSYEYEIQTGINHGISMYGTSGCCANNIFIAHQISKYTVAKCFNGNKTEKLFRKQHQTGVSNRQKKGLVHFVFY